MTARCHSRHSLVDFSSAAIAMTLATTACSAPTDAAAPPPAPVPVTGELAFPGAVGHGAGSRGGRNGRVIEVTTTADTGPGTLRACVEESGPRVCVTTLDRLPFLVALQRLMITIWPTLLCGKRPRRPALTGAASPGMYDTVIEPRSSARTPIARAVARCGCPS